MRTINAFVDDSHDDYDQAVENIQREAFTPMEIALFIEKRERMGDERAAIAKRLGKSKAFVTRHASLLELEPELRALYDSGRTRDHQNLYNLSIMAKEHPDAVARLVDGKAEITRQAVEALRASLQGDKKQARQDAPALSGEPAPSAQPSPEVSTTALAFNGDYSTPAEAATKGEPSLARQERNPASGARAKKSVVMVSRKKALFVLRVDLAPSALHMGWIEDPATGQQAEVELAELRIDSIVSR
jgi:ParB family chromosome partitioning protein